MVEPDLVSLTLLVKSLKDHLNGIVEEPFDIFIIPKTVLPKEIVPTDPMIMTVTNKPQTISHEEQNVERLLPTWHSASRPAAQVFGAIPTY